MDAFGNLVLNIFLFYVGITAVSGLDVTIETLEDDGTRDLWTFEDSSLKSQLHYIFIFLFINPTSGQVGRSSSFSGTSNFLLTPLRHFPAASAAKRLP